MKKFIIFTLLSIFILNFAVFGLNVSPKCENCSNANNLKNYEAKMSIVIDDFGSYDQSGVDKLLTCPVPLTCAVIPNVDNTTDNISKITHGNHELILHMPMESHVYLPTDWYGPTYIRNNDSPEMAVKKLDECIKEFPDIKGMNIHIGSGVSRNKTLMSTIYDWAKEHNLYFLDSRTIETKATEEASKETNSIYLGRDVFLEADKNRTYSGVQHRLLEGANLALEKGCSIVIGHVGAEGGENTARAILDTLPLIEKMNIKIVPLSEIYEDMHAAGVMSNMENMKKANT